MSVIYCYLEKLLLFSVVLLDVQRQIDALIFWCILNIIFLNPLMINNCCFTILHLQSSKSQYFILFFSLINFTLMKHSKKTHVLYVYCNYVMINN